MLLFMTDFADTYLVPSEEELITITFLDKFASQLGNPHDLTTDAGLKLMDAVVGAWMKHFPQEVIDWQHDVALDLAFEKDIKELTKDTSVGYNPVGYPPHLFQLIKAMFPDMGLQKKKVFKKLMQLYPKLFTTSNYA